MEVVLKYRGGSEVWRRFSSMEVVFKYGGGFQVWRRFSSMEAVFKYGGGFQVVQMFCMHQKIGFHWNFISYGDIHRQDSDKCIILCCIYIKKILI